jgi:mannose-1-phosphate guanylyltransferase/mannose-6-phosphate isomerase
MKVIILAGGTGTRLWPLSTELIPKQFLSIDGGKSLIQQTYDRVVWLVDSFDDIYISTNEQFKTMTLEHFAWAVSESHIITEPTKKNTGPAMALMTSYLIDQGVMWDEPLLFVAADHDIRPVDDFHRYMQLAAKKMEWGQIIIFGITPNRPEIWYGYIHVQNKDIEAVIQPVHQFVEKPDRDTAQQYINEWWYYRNSGIFMTTIDTLKQEFAMFNSQWWSLIQWGYQWFVARYDMMEEIPFDKAVMERTSHAMVVPMNLQWSDVGSRDSIYEISPHDDHDNVVLWDIKLHNVSRSYIRSIRTPIRINDIDDLIVVECDDGIYITRAGSSQHIKKVL